MDKQIVEIAATAIHVSTEVAEKHSKQVPQIEGWYFWNPARGGLSVLVNKAGEKLSATSAISFEKHLSAFCSGKRN